MGCGPGHVARYLRDQGVNVCGVDLSPAMVERARRLVPGVEFQQGDMMALGVIHRIRRYRGGGVHVMHKRRSQAGWATTVHSERFHRQTGRVHCTVSGLSRQESPPSPAQGGASRSEGLTSACAPPEPEQ
ncbi:MAG TPA: class I SAM-dependent methyltransferase [Verrucomicrobiae bacterium]|nr:class I SAM-dependent methyltransferase [Verrucomicrobiae bacterium]